MINPYRTVLINGQKIRAIEIDEEVWYLYNDVLKAIHNRPSKYQDEIEKLPKRCQCTVLFPSGSRMTPFFVVNKEGVNLLNQACGLPDFLYKPNLTIREVV